MNIPTYGFGIHVASGLAELNQAFDESRVTPLGLVMEARADDDFGMLFEFVDSSIRTLFPHEKHESSPDLVSEEAQAATGGIALAIFMAKRMGARPSVLRSIMSQRLDLETPKTEYPNDAKAFLTVADETLEDLDVTSDLIQGGHLTRTEDLARHFRAGFGFVLSAALEEYALRDEAA